MRFVVLAVILSSPVAFAEGMAPIASGLLLHEGLEQVVQRERRLNRADTEFRWDGADVQFPCREEIAKAKAANKLPTLTINGERHDAPYCTLRTSVLTGRMANATDAVCLAHERFDIGQKNENNIGGLEHPDLKALTLLLSAFDESSRRALAKRQGKAFPNRYGGITGLLDVFEKETMIRILKDNLPALRREFPDGAAVLELLEKATVKGEGALKGRTQTAWLEDLRGKSEQLAPIVRKLTGLLTKDLEDRIKDGKFGDEPAPKSLQLEVALALREIENAVARPDDVRAAEASNQMYTYLTVRWRDRFMARHLAQLYCDNLKADRPKMDFQAVTGQLHVAGIARLLAPNGMQSGISMFAINGDALADRFAWLIGDRDQATGRYADQGVVLERNNGKPFALSKQMGGSRITLLLDATDPIVGLPLNGPLSIRVWGPDGALQKHLGLDESKPVPTAELIRIANEMRSHYTPPKR